MCGRLVMLSADLAAFRRVDEHHGKPDAVVDVVAAASPAPAVVVAETSRHAGHLCHNHGLQLTI